MASFGVDIWNPTNVGSHSTDEQSRDQWCIIDGTSEDNITICIFGFLIWDKCLKKVLFLFVFLHRLD